MRWSKFIIIISLAIIAFLGFWLGLIKIAGAAGILVAVVALAKDARIWRQREKLEFTLPFVLLVDVWFGGLDYNSRPIAYIIFWLLDVISLVGILLGSFYLLFIN